jgi:carboxypeptidase Taq
LWENQVGRSRGFWRWALPLYREIFPEAHRADLEALWPVFHVVEPSLIRVDADEVTYNLHIVLRFEIERALFSGDLEVAELPQAWNDAYEQLLGVRPENDALGVLQDIHWSQGLFGYFPTYALGSVIGAQLFAAAGRELGGLEERFAEGDFASLLDWLRRNVHGQGARYPAPELVERVTGKPLSAADLLDHLRGNVEKAYGVRLAASSTPAGVPVGASSQR